MSCPCGSHARHVPGDGGRAWKHLRGDCPLLKRRNGEGFEATKVRNPDARLLRERHRYRRCPECFTDEEALTIPNSPRWLERAAILERAAPSAAFWTYVLRDPASRHVQVGMATHLTRRLRSRWLATLKSRFATSDAIPWLHDRLREDQPTSRTPMPHCTPRATRRARTSAGSGPNYAPRAGTTAATCDRRGGAVPPNARTEARARGRGRVAKRGGFRPRAAVDRGEAWEPLRHLVKRHGRSYRGELTSSRDRAAVTSRRRVI